MWWCGPPGQSPSSSDLELVTPVPAEAAEAELTALRARADERLAALKDELRIALGQG